MALWVVSFNMSAAVQHKSFAGKFFRLPPCGSVDFSGVQSEEISLNFHVFYKKIDQSGACGGPPPRPLRSRGLPEGGLGALRPCVSSTAGGGNYARA